MAENYLGENTPKLGFGLMRLPRKGGAQGMGPFGGGEIDVELVKQMVDYFLDNGFTYFDTAYVYGGSEEAACEALVKRHPRDKYTIATKLNIGAMMSGGGMFMFGAPPANPPSVEEGQKKMIEQFETSLSRLGTDYVDFYMLHGLGGDTIASCEKYGAWDFVKQLKKDGRIRHFGLSFHGTPEELEGIFAAHPDAEFVQLQLNYLDWEDERVQSRKCYEVARRHKIPVTVMEPVKGGTLANENSVFAKHFKSVDPDASAASWALRYIADLPGLIAVLSGMSDMEQMKDNVRTFKSIKPLTDADRKTYADAIASAKSVPSVPCTGCGYCNKCPQNIAIPRLLSLYNEYLVHGTLDRRMYAMTTGGFGAAPGAAAPGKPGDCVDCKQCEGECPQHIEISSYMKKIAVLAQT